MVSNEGKYQMTGQINGAAGQMVILQELPVSAPGQQPQVNILDSTTTDSEGRFTLSGQVAEPYIALLTLDQSRSALVYLDGGTYTFTADYNNFGNYVVDGSPASTDLKQLLDNVNQLATQVRQTQQASQTARQQRLPAEQQSALQDQEWGTFDRYYNYLVGYIESSKYPVSALFACDLLDPTVEFDLLKATLAKYPEYAASKYFVKVRGKVDAVSATLGREAPDIRLPNPQGDTMALSDLRGQIVLLDFWAAWCGPCRRENPNVVKLYDQYSDKGFTVFSVSLDRNMNDWVSAIEKDDLKWEYHVSELKFWQTEAIKPYGVTSIPATFLLDKDGRIIAQNLRGYALERKMAQLLGEK